MAPENTNTHRPSPFHDALRVLRPPPAAGPINRAAIRRDAGHALEKATSLLGYHEYLTNARDWKARARAVPVGFEREVQAQAAGALVDAHALASATLRMTSQLKHSGRLDRMFSRALAALVRSGAVTTGDLVADLQHDASIRQTLRDEGVADDVWSSLLANLTRLDANVLARDDKLTADVKVGQDQRRTVAFVPSATGMPRTLSDLLRRGTFERLAPTFIENGGASLQLLPGPPRDLEVPEVVLGVSMLCVQSLAAHKRGLQDVGLAKYAGGGPVLILAVAALACLVVGYLLYEEYCPEDSMDSPSAACIAAIVLLILGTLGAGLLLMVGLATLFPAGPGGPPSCPNTTVYVYDPETGKFVFSHCEPF